MFGYFDNTNYHILFHYFIKIYCFISTIDSYTGFTLALLLQGKLPCCFVKRDFLPCNFQNSWATCCPVVLETLGQDLPRDFCSTLNKAMLFWVLSISINYHTSMVRLQTQKTYQKVIQQPKYRKFFTRFARNSSNKTISITIKQQNCINICISIISLQIFKNAWSFKINKRKFKILPL